MHQLCDKEACGEPIMIDNFVINVIIIIMIDNYNITIEGFGGKRALGFLLKIELCRKRSKFRMQFCLGALNKVLYVFLLKFSSFMRYYVYAKKPVFVVSSARDRKDGNFTYNPAKY